MKTKPVQQPETPDATDTHTQSDQTSDPLGGFLSDIEHSSPDPSDAAIASYLASNKPTETTPEQRSGTAPQSTSGSVGDQYDSEGNRFDPAIHATKPDGSPSLTSSGKFRKKRQSKVHRPGAEKAAQSDPQSQQLTEQQKAQARAAGVACAEIMFRSAQVLGGPEWEPIKDDKKGIDERRDMHEAFALYCEQKGVTDIPPGALLAITIAAYAMPRFALPETQSRTKRFTVWVANKFYQLRGRKKNAARSDSGNDGKRENASSEADSKGKEGKR